MAVDPFKTQRERALALQAKPVVVVDPTTGEPIPPVTASHYQSGMILRSQNNSNQRIAFDWVEFETAP